MRNHTGNKYRTLQIVTLCTFALLSIQRSIRASYQEIDPSSHQIKTDLERAETLAEKGLYKEAIETCNKSLSQLVGNSKSASMNRVRLLEHLAIIYAMNDQFERASSYAVEAKTTLEKIVDPSDFSLLCVRTTLAKTLVSQCKYTEAKSLIDITLSKLTNNLEPRQENVNLTGINMLKYENYKQKYHLYQGLMQYDLARESILLAMKSIEHESGPRIKESKLVSQNDLALVLIELGRFQDAERIATEVMANSEGIWTSDSMNKGVTIGCLATVYREQGRYKESLPLMFKVLEICEKHNGKDHLAVADLLDKIGRMLIKMDRHSEALIYLKRSYSIRKKAS